MRGIVILRAVFLVVVVALIVCGVLFWRGIIHFPGKAVVAKTSAPGAPASPKATHAPIGLPPDAPKIGSDLDPAIINPFAVRVTQVNKLAHQPIVVSVEYHDTPQGDRYYLAVVKSCKDLDKLWPIKRGVLESKVEDPLRLKSEFTIFSFVELDSQGQWGVASCDDTI